MKTFKNNFARTIVASADSWFQHIVVYDREWKAPDGVGGMGYHQVEGGAVEVLHPGDVAFCPPGVPHRHGGSLAGTFAHIAVNTNPEKTGLEWKEFLSEEEYRKLQE